MNDDGYEICPVCNNDTLEPGEIVDVGFGPRCGPKCSPDYCSTCGYTEQGPDPDDLPFEHFKKCWELQVDPFPPPHPEVLHGPVDARYGDWITWNVEGSGYGKCERYSAEMALAFPELRRVYGFYYCLVWGQREHFFLVDENNNVVDPTVAQFPSKGGPYIIKKFMPVHASVTAAELPTSVDR